MIKREWMEDRVRLILENGDKKISREITYLQLKTSKMDVLTATEDNMYEQFLRM